MIDHIRSTIPLFVLFAGVGMAVILMTRRPEGQQAPPTPQTMQSSTRSALLELASDPTTALSACQTAYDTGATDAAVDICTAALETLPEEGALYLLRGQAHELQGQRREAISDYRAAIRESDPSDDLYEAASIRLEALTEDP